MAGIQQFIQRVIYEGGGGSNRWSRSVSTTMSLRFLYDNDSLAKYFVKELKAKTITEK